MKRSVSIRTLVVVSVLALITGVRAYQSGQPAPSWTAKVEAPAASPALVDGLSKIGEFRHSSPGTTYTLSHSGDLLLFGFNNHGKGHFTVREAKTGAVITDFSAPFGLFYFMPDGKSVIVHGFHAITAWETRSGKQLWSVATKSEERGVPTTRGPIVTTNQSELTIRAGDDGGLVRSFPMVEDLHALSGDGSTILLSKADSSTAEVVWTNAGTKRHSLTLPTGTTARMGELDEAGTIAAIVLDGEKGQEIGFWELTTGGRLPVTIDGERVQQIAMTRDGKTLILQRSSGSLLELAFGNEGDVEMWDIKAGKMIGAIRAGQFSLSLDGRTIAVSRGDTYQLWRLAR